MATVLRPDSEPEILSPANGVTFTLTELQTLVGGYIEALRVPYERDLWMILNEDGKRLELAVNHVATMLMRTVIRPDDLIVGDVVICTHLELEGEPAEAAEEV